MADRANALSTLPSVLFLNCVEFTCEDNSLYINGLKEKDLEAPEVEEFNRYLSDLSKFREKIRRLMGWHRNASIPTTQFPQSGVINYDPSVTGPNLTLPEAPQKPSFCTHNVTTQYVFDGCKVQNNKLYISNQYVRDLTSEEQEQLKKFDEQMTKYHDQISDNIQKQVERIFGKSFSRFYGSNSVTKIEDEQEGSTTPMTSIQMPEAPEFCTRTQ